MDIIRESIFFVSHFFSHFWFFFLCFHFLQNWKHLKTFFFKDTGHYMHVFQNHFLVAFFFSDYHYHVGLFPSEIKEFQVFPQSSFINVFFLTINVYTFQTPSVQMFKCERQHLHFWCFPGSFCDKWERWKGRFYPEGLQLEPEVTKCRGAALVLHLSTQDRRLWQTSHRWSPGQLR